MGDVDARVHIHTAMALGRGRVANPTLGCLYLWGKPLVLDQSGHEVKKNLHPSNTRD